MITIETLTKGHYSQATGIAKDDPACDDGVWSANTNEASELRDFVWSVEALVNHGGHAKKVMELQALREKHVPWLT